MAPFTNRKTKLVDLLCLSFLSFCTFYIFPCVKKAQVSGAIAYDLTQVEQGYVQ